MRITFRTLTPEELERREALRPSRSTEEQTERVLRSALRLREVLEARQ